MQETLFSKSGSNGTALYLYDGTALYLYDGAGHLLGEYDGSTGTAVQETVWFEDLPVVLMTGTTASAALYNIHADHLRAPKVITDQTGSTVWNWTHGPFGKENPTGTLTYNLRFPGQYYDEETGLSYNMNRNYDAQTGRYVESDPIGLEGGINTYGYVGQNPLWAVDPDGLMAVSTVLLATAAGAVALGAVGTEWWKSTGSELLQKSNSQLSKMLNEALGSVKERLSNSDRVIKQPPKPRRGVTCTCRASSSGQQEGNCPEKEYAFGTATAPTQKAARASAERIARQKLGKQAKHTQCKCTDNKGNVLR